jgi:ABC-2 type transport system permease protein
MPRSDVLGERRTARVVALVTARRAIRSGAIWGVVFGGSVALIASSYAGTFPTAASRARLASSLAGNVGLTALYGQVRRIDTVAGFTAWRTGAIVWIGAIWGLLIATRLLRGEEEAGRWELFLAGRTTRRHAAVQAVAGLGAGLATLWILTAVFTVAIGSTSDIGFSIGASLFFATTLVAGAAVFLAVGVLVAELGATRHQANVIGAVVLAAGLLIRMVADSGVGLDWLRWLSPFGWIQELHPLTGSRPVVLVPIACLIVACVAAAVRLAGARDLGSSALPSRDTSPPRTRLLGGQAGLTVRLMRPAVATWVAGLAVCGLLFGLIAQGAATALRGAKGMEDAIARLGGRGPAAASFLGLEFVIVALFVAFAAAGQIAAARAEEAEGHLDHLLARPVARWRWLAGRLGVGVGLVLSTSVLTGVAAWAGAATQHSPLGFGRLVEAGLNVAPAALFVLGVGALVFGVWPRAATGVTYGLLAWSFLLELVGALVNANHWLLDTSLLTHIAPAPAADPNWTAAAWLVGLGLLAALAGTLGFRRRDLAAA